MPYCTKLQRLVANQIEEGEDYFCIDSKPIAVCRLSRSYRCHFGRGQSTHSHDWGYCASQPMHYFGYKLHAVCGLRGVIHSYDISKASVHNIHYLREIKDQFSRCTIIGDRGYIRQKSEPLYLRHNMLGWNIPIGLIRKEPSHSIDFFLNHVGG